jgi:hypothetical protein
VTTMCDDSSGRNPCVELTQLATDDEGWWHLTVTVTDRTYAVQQECYVYPSDLLDWAGQLSRFPKVANDEVQFAIGIASPPIGCDLALGSSIGRATRRSRSISGAQATTFIDGRRALPSDATWAR